VTAAIKLELQGCPGADGQSDLQALGRYRSCVRPTDGGRSRSRRGRVREEVNEEERHIRGGDGTLVLVVQLSLRAFLIPKRTLVAFSGTSYDMVVHTAWSYKI
jgi:hypothetical protein